MSSLIRNVEVRAAPVKPTERSIPFQATEPPKPNIISGVRAKPMGARSSGVILPSLFRSRYLTSPGRTLVMKVCSGLSAISSSLPKKPRAM